MLLELRVENYAVIDSLAVEFAAGALRGYIPVGDDSRRRPGIGGMGNGEGPPD